MALSTMRLRSARETAGLSRTELAALIGRSEQTLIAYELGRAVPPTDVVSRIAETLEIHPGDLFDDPDAAADNA